MTQPIIEIEEEEHDCLDNIDTWSWRCTECGEPVDPADAQCGFCGHFPCTCDEQYERYKEDRLGL